MGFIHELVPQFISSIKRDDEGFSEDVGNLGGLILQSTKCQSPIERILFWAIADSFILEHPIEWGEDGDSTPYIPVNVHCWEDSDVVGVNLQFREGPYSIDFVITCWSIKRSKSVQFAIEVDGHDFHEKTKEQAKKDKRRDRYLTSKGYIVVRFTGSEVYNDPYKVVDEIVDQIDSWGRNG